MVCLCVGTNFIFAVNRFNIFLNPLIGLKTKLQIKKSNNVVNSWNKLQQDIKSAKNENVFKNKYDH